MPSALATNQRITLPWQTSQGPRMMAILRNLAIAILRLLGFASVPQGLRHFAQRPRFALNALGL